MDDTAELSLHDAIYSLRAMRRLLPDPVPEQEIRYLIESATQAASATNAQQWAFVVVQDAEQRRQVAELYCDLANRFVRPVAEGETGLPDEQRRVWEHAWTFAQRLSEVPVLIVACMREPVVGEAVSAHASFFGSIFPAVQNLMLAARSRGLGTTLTTLHLGDEKRFKEILEIPEEVQTIAMIPVGYPKGKWRKPKRRPIDAVTHWDRWGRYAKG